jgi:WD40 repeat protein
VIKERQLTERQSPFDSTITKVLFSPDSARLGVLTQGNEVAIYDVERGVSSPLEVSGVVQDIAFSPDSQEFLTSDSDGNIQTWEIASGQWIESPVQAYAPAFSMATSSQFLGIGSTNMISIIGADNDGGIAPLETSGQNTLLAFNKDGSLLASVDSAGRISTWRYQAGQFSVVASFDKERAVSLAFHPQENLLAVGTAAHVYLMDMDGKELARIPHMDTVNSVSFSADGKYLATASSTLLQLWDLEDIQLINSDELIPAACSRLFENFNAEQWETLFPGEEYRPLCEDLQ